MNFPFTSKTTDMHDSNKIAVSPDNIKGELTQILLVALKPSFTDWGLQSAQHLPVISNSVPHQISESW